jgi:hypothetical protein
MARMSLTWTLEHHGWARCVVADDQNEATAIASYVTGGPEYLLTAVARLTLGADTASAEFEAEPDVYRWIFQRAGDQVDIRLLHLDSHAAAEDAGATVWHSQQPVGTLARAVVRAFDAVLATHGETGYETTWGRPFPRVELQALRAARRPTRESQ